MWSILVVVSTPSLQLYLRVGKSQEPVRVQALRPEPAVERFDEGIVGRLAGSGEVQRDAATVSPEVEIAGNELRSLIDADGLRIAS